RITHLLTLIDAQALLQASEHLSPAGQRRKRDVIAFEEWNWPDESGHIWEAQSPHLLYANKCLKINMLDKEVSQGSIKSAFSKPLQIQGSRRKMGSYKFPNVSTVMWPSPLKRQSWRAAGGTVGGNRNESLMPIPDPHTLS